MRLSALDWTALPLAAPWRVLIEASAGTGKTWTIGALYLRALLERDEKVEKILVVTFTDAAAQELRERLRRVLADAEQCLRRFAAGEATGSGEEDDSAIRAWLAIKYVDETAAKPALRRIQIARMDFDRAPIVTIHGFCQRVLRDYPLDSGAALGRDVRLDAEALLRECVDDFWRRRYLGRDNVAADEADALFDGGPEGLRRDIRELLNHDAKVLPADGLVAIDADVAALRTPENIAELRALAENRALYAPRKSQLSNRLKSIATALESGEDLANPKLLDDTFKTETIDAQQSDAAPLRLRELPLIGLLQSLRQLFKRRKNFIRAVVLREACDYCRREIPLRAARAQGTTYSMLIAGVHERVCGNTAFAERLFTAFPVALVDEFQDTDARQFAIFDRIYREADGSKRGWLAMIGDPKQAIYGFRGGDVEAYLRARNSADAQFVLGTNFRSSAALIEACNALYADTDGGFGDTRIRYRRVEPGVKAVKKILLHDGTPVAKPLRIHLFRGDATNQNGESLSKLGDLELLALHDCAARIAELLNDGLIMLGGKPLTPGQIAVLLPNNRQVANMRSCLNSRDVPCAGSGRSSVFDVPVAAELELFLHALLQPDDAAAVRGALATQLLGANLCDVLDWQGDAYGFEMQLDRFARWNALVASRGAFGAIDDMLAQRAAGLLALPDGERIVTDLRHLGELIAEREAADSGLEGVVAWYAAMRGEGGDSEDAGNSHALRIESDAERVKLMTVHAAKGLEFPIVFLPLAWRITDRAGIRQPKVLRFHDAEGDLCADPGSAEFEKNLARHFAEDLRERLRLLYVGMTRAESALHVYWVERNVPSAAPAWNIAGIDVLIQQARCAHGLVPVESSVLTLAERLAGIEVVGPCTARDRKYRSTQHDERPLAGRAPLPEARPFIWSHSFSGIARRDFAAPFDTAAADEIESTAEVPAAPETAEAAHPQLQVLDAWRGRRFGDAVHALLERSPAGPFAQADTLRQLAALGVHADGDEGPALAALSRMLERTVAADLGGGLRLCALAPHERVAEFGFQFPVSVRVQNLRAACVAHGFADLWPDDAEWPVLNGMLVGFADLILLHDGRYHVLDYKTNRLGERLSDFRGAALDAVMAEHRYPLQALLYTVALHRYLRQRLRGYLPERHLGDSVYLFLRAVGLDVGAGVWRRRWPVALIADLDTAFAGMERAA